MRFRNLLIVFFLSSASVYAIVIDKIAAIVNDDVITQSEVFAIEQLKLDLSGLPPKETTLQRRIDHKLVVQQIQRQPPLEILEDEFQSALDAYSARHGGMEEVLVFLNSIGMNYADFEQELRNQIMIRSFIRLRFRPFVNISLEQAEKYYNEVYKPRLSAQPEAEEVPSFEESLEAVQAEMVESGVVERTRDWLVTLRKEANITIKD